MLSNHILLQNYPNNRQTNPLCLYFSFEDKMFRREEEDERYGGEKTNQHCYVHFFISVIDMHFSIFETKITGIISSDTDEFSNSTNMPTI